MKKIKHIQIIVGILIFIIIIIFISIRRKEGHYRSSFKITNLPKFVSVDVYGMEVKSEDFIGKNLYVQFIDANHEMNIELFKDVYSKWKKEDIYFILIINEFERFKSRVGINTENIVILNKDFKELESKFNPSNLMGDRYYLIDNSGKVVTTGPNDSGYENGPKVFLKQIIKNERFHISDLIKLREKIKNMEWFNQVAEVVDKEGKDYFIISMFTSICNGCTSGVIVQFLQRFYSDNYNSVHVLCILSDKFEKKDINILKSQLSLDIPIVIANINLSQKWNYLIQEFREPDLTNIIFITNGSGEILNIYHPNCNCWNQFFSFVKTLKIKGEIK